MSDKKELTANEVFEQIFQELANKNNKKYITGVDTVEDQILVEEWLALHSTQEFFRRGLSPQHLVGFVHRVIDYPESDAQEISYIDQHGMPMVFFWYKSEPAFQNAPNGFREGDVILSILDREYAMKSVKPLNLQPELRKKVLTKIHDAYVMRNKQ